MFIANTSSATASSQRAISPSTTRRISSTAGMKTSRRRGAASARTSAPMTSLLAGDIGAYRWLPRAITPSPVAGCHTMCEPNPGYPPEWLTNVPSSASRRTASP